MRCFNIRFHLFPPALAIFLAVFMLTGVSCSTRVDVSESTGTGTPPRVLLVLPFRDMTIVHGTHVNVRSPLSGKVFMTGEVGEGTTDYLAREVMSHLAQRVEYTLIPPGRAEGVFSQMLSKSEDALSERDLALQLGRSLAADAVVMGHVYRFTARVGNRYSVESPASVAFDLFLMRVDTGRILWSGNVDETQLALSENLFQFGKFLERKGRWVTAQELAEYGMTTVFKTFP